jgi:alkanesulfonate monooxygenase SsuD/methylene tetrahydromethanopterin reductase-like flavin-dependent oxidoreductase (luciferase family)
VKLGILYEICRPEPFDGFLSEEEAYWQAVEQIARAEEIGFEYVWAVEHHFLEGYSVSSAPEVFLSAVAQHTRTIRIGHGVRLLPPRFNHPVRSAEMAAVLDIMSKGRLEMGVGRSLTTAELGGFEISPDESRPMLDEVLPELVKMWTLDEYPGFTGKYFSMPPRKVLPKPIQKPHPPLWMACTQPASFDLAADWGIGALCFGVGAPGNALGSLRRYKDRIRAPGNPIGHFVNNAVAPATVMYCGEDPTESFEKGGAAALWFASNAERLFSPWATTEAKGYEYYTRIAREHRERDISLMLKYGCVGTPDAVASGVAAYEEAGFDQLIFLVQAGRIPHKDIMRSLDLFGREVLPRFRAPALPPAPAP